MGAGAMSPEGTEESGRKRDLDGLRGVAVLMIIFLHYVCRSGFFGNVGPPRIAQLMEASWAGVDIFFVLSGFLIGGIIIDNRDAENFFAAFYRRRALRILPLAFLTIAFSYLILPLANPSVVVGAHVPPYAYLLFINNFWTALGHPGYIPLGPMWSLAIEEQFYLMAPTFLRSIGPRTRNVTLMTVIVISPLLRASHTGLSGWELTPFRLDGFACGILVAGLLRDARYREVVIRNRGVIGALAVGLVSVDLLFASSPHYSLVLRVAFGISLNSLAAAGVILSLQISPGSWIANILSRQWLVACGKYSYFLYLMHVPILLYTMGAYVGGSFVPYVAIALGITFACAWASWRFLESRLIHLGKRYLYSARSIGAATSPYQTT